MAIDDRSSTFLGNVTGGHFGAAFRGVVSPESLSPEESKSLAVRFGATPGGLVDAVVDVVSDPFLILSVLTSWKFPVPSAINVKLKNGKTVPENWFAVSKRYSAAETPLKEFGWQYLSPGSLFAGTPIWEYMVGLTSNRAAFAEKYLKKAGDAVRKFEKGAGRAITVDDQILASAALERLHEKTPTGFKKKFDKEGVDTVFHSLPTDKPFTSFVSDMKGIYKEAYQEMFSDKTARERMTLALNEVSKKEWNTMIKGMEDMGTPRDKIQELKKKGPSAFNEQDLFREVEDYLPHYPVQNLGLFKGVFLSAIESSPTLGKLSETEREVRVNNLMRTMTTMLTKSARTRKERMLPAYEHLTRPAVAKYVRPEAAETIKSIVQSSTPERPVLEYSLHSADVFSTYTHSAASTYAWTIKDLGGKLLDEALLLKKSDPVRYRILMETYTPMLLGKMTPEQANRAQTWANRLTYWNDWLQSDNASFVPKSIRDSMSSWLKNDKGMLSTQPWSQGIAKYLYLSTLGLNPGAAVRNLFQVGLTTGAMGLNPGIGYSRVWNKSQNYFKERQEGKTHAEALRIAFKDYHDAGIPANPDIDDTFQRALQQSYGSAQSGVAQNFYKGKELVERSMMSLFSATEALNRRVTFEAAMHKGQKDLSASMKKSGLALSPEEQREAVLNFARQTTLETQFISGPANTPYWLANKGPVSRQLLTFPSRYLEFLTNTALRVGSAEQNVAGFNPGTLARAYIWSDLLAETGQHVLGMDFGDALLEGAVPAPTGFGPFAPLPFVPPALSLAGAPALDFASGDANFSETRRALPLLFPGGVGLAKAVGVLPGGEAAAKVIARRYVDYSSPAPDGRYPFYTDQGNLIGFLTPTQIMMQGLGLGQSTDVRQEQEVYATLIKNRERLRGLKKTYVRAVVDADWTTAESANLAFKEMIPQVEGLDKMISKAEIEAELTRRQITRAEKLLDTLPPEVRPVYAQALQTAMLNLGPEFMGLEEGGLTAAPTAKNRPRTTPLQRPPSQTDTGLQSLKTTGPAFSSFAAFEF